MNGKTICIKLSFNFIAQNLLLLKSFLKSVAGDKWQRYLQVDKVQRIKYYEELSHKQTSLTTPIPGSIESQENNS